MDLADAEATLALLAAALFPDGTGELGQLSWETRGDGEPQPSRATARAEGASTEAKLRAAELRYRTLVEQIPAVTFMAVLGEGENEVYVSPHIEALLGFTQQEWLENPFLWYSQLHPDDRAIWNEEFARGCRTGGPFRAECRFLARDGHVVWVRGEARLVKDEQGRPLFLQGVAFDITESKRAQALQLQQAVGSTEQRYRDLVEQLGAIFWEAEVATSRFTFVSVGAERILGFPRERWISDPGFWISVVHPGDRDLVTGVWKEALAAGGDHEFEYRAITFDQREVWLHARIRGPVPAAGERYLFGVVLDVTERKHAEQERSRLYAAAEEARKAAESANRAKDEFLATMSHELRTPLNALLGYAQLLREKKMPAAIIDRALESIERSALTQSKLVEDLLDVSRIITGKLHLDSGAVDLRAVIHGALDATRLAAESKRITVTVTESSSLIVWGDASRLQQVVWNLLSNAIKFTPEGGKVEVQLDRAGDHARIRVRDSGQGINSDFLPHVFDRFRQADSSMTRQFGGLGLGLAIVRHLTELHGGTVSAHSTGLGQGATFIVELPLAVIDGSGVKPPAAEPRVEEQMPRLDDVSILVVDDDPDSRELLRTILTHAGAEVATAASAAEAMKELTRFVPDVLISDIGMPNEDGYQLLSRVRASGLHGRQLPTVALTAYASEEHRRRAMEAGFQEHVTKPINVADMIRLVAGLAGVRRG